MAYGRRTGLAGRHAAGTHHLCDGALHAGPAQSAAYSKSPKRDRARSATIAEERKPAIAFEVERTRVKSEWPSIGPPSQVCPILELVNSPCGLATIHLPS